MLKPVHASPCLRGTRRDRTLADVDRPALEALWRTRLNDARTRLNFARNYANEVQQDFSTGYTSAPQERYAFEKALRAERAALAEYARILAIFSDLTLHGKIPHADDWPGNAMAARGE